MAFKVRMFNSSAHLSAESTPSWHWQLPELARQVGAHREGSRQPCRLETARVWANGVLLSPVPRTATLHNSIHSLH